MLPPILSRSLRQASPHAWSVLPALTNTLQPTCRRIAFARSFGLSSGPQRTFEKKVAPLAIRTAYTAAKDAFTSERVQGVKIPSAADLEEAEMDAEVLSAEDIQLRISDRAAEKLRTISAREGTRQALRIAVESGGCHGYQYKLELADPSAAAPEDYILQHPSSSDAALVVDAVSLPLLNGSLVDFATELIGSSFRVVDNPNATGKGCGCGVSWELKA